MSQIIAAPLTKNVFDMTPVEVLCYIKYLHRLQAKHAKQLREGSHDCATRKRLETMTENDRRTLAALGPIESKLRTILHS